MNGIFLGKIGIQAVVLAIGMVAVNTFGATPNVSKGALPPVKPSKTYLKLEKEIVLDQSEVIVLDKEKKVRAVFAINNSSKVDVKDVEIVCVFVDKANGERDREKWVVKDTVKAQKVGISTQTIEKTVSNEAIGTQCQIVDVKIVTTPKDSIPHAETK